MIDFADDTAGECFIVVHGHCFAYYRIKVPCACAASFIEKT
jgi:hypothetical protein